MDGILDLYPAPSQRFNRKGITDLIAYWNGLRRDGEVPARALIDPVAIQPYLGRAAIVERTSSGYVKVRLAGSDLKKLFGMDPRGMPLRALFDTDARQQALELLNAVFDGPAILSMTVSAQPDNGPEIHGELIVLPLKDMAGDVTRALVMLVTTPVSGTAPVRFRVGNFRISDISAPPRAVTALSARMPSRVRVQRGERPHLTVIDGGRI